MTVYENHVKEGSELQDRYTLASDRNLELVEQVESLKAALARDDELVAEARAKVKALKGEVYKLTIIEKQVTESFQALKGERNDLIAHVEKNELLRQDAARDKQRIKSRIVHSPEKFQQNLAEMQRSLQDEKSLLSEKSIKLRDLTAKCDVLTILEQDILSCLKMMKECEQEVMRVDALSKEVNTLRDVMEQKQLEVRDFSVRENQLQRQLGNAKEKIARATQQLESNRNAARTRMVQMAETRRELQEDRLKAGNEIDKKRSIIEGMRVKMLELQTETTNDITAVQAEFEKLKRHVDTYIGEVDRSMLQSQITV